MKKKTAILLISPFIITNCFSETTSIQSKYPNHFYIGADAFAFTLHTHIKNIRMDGTRYFIGPLLRYEYLKPKALYAGVDFLASWGNKNFKTTTHNFKFHKTKEVGFGNFELRLGYTFQQKIGLVSPYLGTGFYGFGNSASNEILVYFATGMRSLFELNPTFSMGLNLKLMFAPEAEQEFKYHYLGEKKRVHEIENMWGGEIGLPLIWYFSTMKRWKVQLEPYFLKLNFAETQNIYGFRLLFGYRF